MAISGIWGRVPSNVTRPWIVPRPASRSVAAGRAVGADVVDSFLQPRRVALSSDITNIILCGHIRSVTPPGLTFLLGRDFPTACAMGYGLSPLRAGAMTWA